jgi:hypothetical protein
MSRAKLLILIAAVTVTVTSGSAAAQTGSGVVPAVNGPNAAGDRDGRQQEARRVEIERRAQEAEERARQAYEGALQRQRELSTRAAKPLI